MIPAKLNLTIYQGSTYVKPFQWKSGTTTLTPVDISTCTMRMDIRKKITDPTEVLELTTENGRLVIVDGALGKFEIRLSAADTATFNFTQAVYDIEVVYPSEDPVVRVLEGSIKVIPEVTR